MEKMRLFASVLIVGTLIVFVGCKKNEDDNQEGPITEVQQQPAVPAVESTALPEHEVVLIVREFLKAIEDGDYEHAIELGTPNEFTVEGLTKFKDVFQLGEVEVIKAYVGNEQAAVLTNTIAATPPAPAGQFGYSLLRNGNGWLIRDSDFLPNKELVENRFAGFKGVEPNAKRVLEEN